MGQTLTEHGAYASTGIYTLAEAAHIAGIHPVRVRRWLLGYRFPLKGGAEGRSAPVVPPQLPEIGGHRAIGFLDLVELLFVDAFRREGVTLQTVRKAAREAARRWGSDHPFCLKRFATDGRTIFATVDDGIEEPGLLELTRSQYCFDVFLRPYLKQLDYDDLGGVGRWWPLGKDKLVFLDPAVAFGRPVVGPVDVPTEALYQAVLANDSEKDVARWYDLPVAAVRAAVEFEKTRAA